MATIFSEEPVAPPALLALPGDVLTYMSAFLPLPSVASLLATNKEVEKFMPDYLFKELSCYQACQ
jgi:hypothetical protein